MVKISVSVIDGVYGRPAAGVEVCVLCEPPDEPPGGAAGLTDTDGIFSVCAAGDRLPGGQHWTIRVNVDHYFASLGILGGCRQISLAARMTGPDADQRVTTVITPFTFTTWMAH